MTINSIVIGRKIDGLEMPKPPVVKKEERATFPGTQIPIPTKQDILTKVGVSVPPSRNTYGLPFPMPSTGDILNAVLNKVGITVPKVPSASNPKDVVIIKN